MKKNKLFIVFLVLTLFLSACQNRGEEFEDNSDKLNVYVSFYPMEFLATRIGGDKINIKTIVPKGMEPHDFEPSLRNMKNLDKTDIFIYNGLGMEAWADDLVDAVDNKEMTLVNSSDSISPIDTEEGRDPHIWLNPRNMIAIGDSIKDALVEKDGKNKDYYIASYETLKEELEELDQAYRTRLAGKKHDEILVSHEAFSYMAESYGFKQISVAGISSEEEPSSKNIARLIDISKEKELRYIFLETLSNSKAVDIISKEAGLEVLVLNPLEGLTEEDIEKKRDYISIMYDNLKELEKALVI